MLIDVIIPAFNEEKSVGKVVADIPKNVVNEVIVVNNNSTDQTAQVAMKAGAKVLHEHKRGYGNACLKGMAYIAQKDKKPDVVVFMDADYSDFPGQLSAVVAPIIHNGYDMVIGSRTLGARESGSMTPQQVFGNWLATKLIKLFYGAVFTDLGPFRAIRYNKLLEIDMKDRNYGWTVEMQLKAAKNGLKTKEVPVDYRKRIGVSKVSGTVKGTISAGYKIIVTIFRYL